MNTTITNRPTARAARWAAVLSLAGLALTACAGGAADVQPASTETTTEAAQPVATPTKILPPDPLDSCVLGLEATEGSDYADRVRIECGTEDPIVLGGDFRNEVSNRYDPVAASGVTRGMVVGQDIRVWTETCFLNFDQDEDDHVDCEPLPGESDTGAGEEALSPEGLAEQHA